MSFRGTMTAFVTSCALCASSLDAAPQLRALYGKLDPLSASQHLALYHLYPQSDEGEKALARAWQLLTRTSPRTHHFERGLPLPLGNIGNVVALINAHPSSEVTELDESSLKLIESLASHLPNRKLAGHQIQTLDALDSLEPKEIDLARALFLTQMGEAAEPARRRYEAMIDLMALQILARVDFSSSAKDKITAISHFVFDEMNFRFPPHSTYARDIDEYTFLSSVLDGRRGVCLGVSLLYVCLAQRLGLELELVTPPGHIFVRYQGGEINIETTLRGIHIDTEDYLGLEIRSLKVRDLREAVGFVHVNAASVYLTQGAPEKALEEYRQAERHLAGDPLLHELMGFAYLLSGEEDKGRKLLTTIRHHLAEEATAIDTLADDYLSGQIDAKGLKVMFSPVDERRESLIAKKEELENVLARWPKFRSGWLQLATTWMQMHRSREALTCLQTYHALHPNNPSAEYYLSILYAERLQFDQAWEHLRRAEALVEARNHSPKALKQFRRELALHAI